MQRTVGKFRQRGLADNAGPILLLVYGIIGAWILAFLATVAITAWVVKGKFTFPAVVAVLAFWIWLFQAKVSAPLQKDKEDTNFRMAAQGQCTSDLLALERFYEVDGVLDEAASIKKRIILQLLAERKLTFLEFKVQQFKDGKERIAYKDGDADSHWLTNRPIGSFVRIELGKTGDLACGDAAIWNGVDRDIVRPPFLHDTCLKVSYSDTPTARFVIRHNAGTHPVNPKFAYWQLVDQKNNTVLAQLTTSDQSTFATSVLGGIARDGENPETDCRAPHKILVDHLLGQDQSQKAHPQVLRVVKVRASALPDELLQAHAVFPRLKPSIEVTGIDQSDWRAADARQWPDAVAQARKTGWGAYNSQLLDWKNRQLISLTVTKNPSDPRRWTTSAGDDGFWVRSTRVSWDEEGKNLLAHYAADGHLRWAALVDASNLPVVEGSCEMVPHSMQFSRQDISFFKQCRTEHFVNKRLRVGYSAEGVTWRFKRVDLPKGIKKEAARP